MSQQDTIQAELLRLAEPVCRAHGVELVDVRWLRRPGGSVVRIIIDRERVDGGDVPGSGVSLADCTNVSRDLSSILDMHEDLIPGSYDLEVSSPGVERPLVKLRDFERFAGREVKLETKIPVGDRRRYQGRLLGVEDGAVRLEQDGAVVSIPFDTVNKAHLVVRF